MACRTLPAQKLKIIFTEIFNKNITAKNPVQSRRRLFTLYVRFRKVPTEFSDFQNKPNPAILTNEYCAIGKYKFAA